MARQASAPVQFNRTTRTDQSVLMTSGRAGRVVPVGYIPLLPGDSASGRMGVDIQLAEMPRPLLNAVTANIQAWFVPKSAHPKFAGRDELNHAFTGQSIKALGQDDRVPPTYFTSLNGASVTTVETSLMFRTLGLHVPAGENINSDLIDAFMLVYNFRLAAHSSRLERRPYAQENLSASTALQRAFWPSSRLSRVVPDYERALIVGSLDLDVVAGRLPVTGLGISNGTQAAPTYPATEDDQQAIWSGLPSGSHFGTKLGRRGEDAIMQTIGGVPQVFAQMAGQAMSISLADLDKARTTQAFAKLRTAYAGNDTTGFENDDTIVALLMQGISVPADQFKRPWLLDSKRVPVGFSERFATDAANLDASVTQGRASAVLNLNVPMQDVGGVIVFTVEVLPERLDERMSDEWLCATTVNELPNALRDVQRVEPVDLVRNRRVDAKHTTPGGLYGYEPMNDVWNRSFTRLGGVFFQATPGTPYSEQRAAIWQTDIVDPVFSDSHFLAPWEFPHDVFSDTAAPAFEVVCRHQVAIAGLTQIGDVLSEANDDYLAIESAGV